MYEEQATGWGGTLWRSRGAGAEPIPADGSVDLILRGDALLLAGPSTRFLWSTPDAGVPTVGIRLDPGISGAFLGSPPDESRDALVDPRDVLPSARRSELEHWRTWLAELRSTPALTPAATSGLRSWPPVPGELGNEQRWAATVRRVAAAGAPASETAALLGWSERQFRREMRARFGFGYAVLTRILRAESARSLIRAGHSLTAVAALAGYADQPHLTREFARLTGHSPAGFSARARPPDPLG